jgi:hypothetical protein
MTRIFLDNNDITENIGLNLPLAVLASIFDRVLVRRSRHIVAISADGRNVFMPASMYESAGSFGNIECFSGDLPAEPRKAVVTLAIGECGGMKETAFPFMRRYAEKIGADFVPIESPKLFMPFLEYEKWQMYDLLFEYDRILYLDVDILVSPRCPDLFAEVPLEKTGGLDEGKYIDRTFCMRIAQEQLGDIGWRSGYLNAGMGVYSYIHRPLFMKRPNVILKASFADQTMYNYCIKQLGFSIHDLAPEFNRMDMFGPDRLQGYIIHYAGSGYTGRTNMEQARKEKLILMKEDAVVLRAINEYE